MQLWWILAHAFMGDIIGAITHFALTEESGDVNFGGVVAFAAIWLLTGPLLAAVQCLFIRRRLAPKTQWFAGTVVGWWLGVPIGMLLPIGIWSIVRFYDLELTGSSSELMFQTPLCFAILGVVQWSALRSQVIAAWQWIYVSVFGGLVVSSTAAILALLGTPATVAGSLGWAGYGVITWHLFIKNISLRSQTMPLIQPMLNNCAEADSQN
jgi:hypothetical protein